MELVRLELIIEDYEETTIDSCLLGGGYGSCCAGGQGFKAAEGEG